MSDLKDKIALVTGASGGIGAAISLALAKEGMQLLLTGRNAGRLAAVGEKAREASPRVELFALDLTDDAQLRSLATSSVDVLVHSVGLFHAGPFATAPAAELDAQYRVNVRVPYLLTQALLPSLIARQGQVVFVNSSAGHHDAKAGVGTYSATKHALRALADSLRDEVNKQGVRVLTVFPGRTATAMQEEVHRIEGKPYAPENLLQPEDVAAAVVHALTLPRTAELTDLRIRPMRPLPPIQVD